MELAVFTRRQFVTTLMAGVAMSSLITCRQKESSTGMPKRQLGKTGEYVSIIGLGGMDVVLNKSDEEAVNLIREALDGGISFWDNCWEYNNGRSEKVMGKVLRDSSIRDKVFLMSKTCARDYNGVKKQLEESLDRLRTDRIDLYQIHAIQYPGDKERIFHPETGALKAMLEAKKEGKIRHIGFTGHKDPAIHQGMLSMPFEWDTVQMPLNVVDAHNNSFQKKVLPILMKRNIGALGMKSLAAQDGRIPRDLKISADLCRKYALSLPVSTVICGLQTKKEVEAVLKVGHNFKPLTENEINALLDDSKWPSSYASIEEYKVSPTTYGCYYHSHILEKEHQYVKHEEKRS
jgi:predicted aldo/keto reductase-like oxidoreductase